MERCSGMLAGHQCLLEEGHEGMHYCGRNDTQSALFRPYQLLQEAFDKAEVDTAHMFDGQTCMMKTVEGHNDCPICYFRKQVKKYLGLDDSSV